MKTWMKVVLGIVAGITVLIGFVFWLTGDVTKAGDDFFAAVQMKISIPLTNCFLKISRPEQQRKN